MRPSLWVCLGLLLTAAPVAAGERTHLAAPGESFQSLAEHYWGRAALGDSLRLYNDLSQADLVPGTTLRIPFAVRHRVQEGESWASLAQAHWHDQGLDSVLAKLAQNGTGPLRPGAQVVVPALLPHRVLPGQTLAALSRLCYGHSARALLIGQLNGVAEPRRLRSGALVWIPLAEVPPDGDSPPKSWARPADEPPGEIVAPEEASSGRSEAIERAASAHRSGDYSGALAQIESLLADVLAHGSHEERGRLLTQLVRLYVAFDRASDACKAYRALRRVDPAQVWDPETTSPKVIRMTRGC